MFSDQGFAVDVRRGEKLYRLFVGGDEGDKVIVGPVELVSGGS